MVRKLHRRKILWHCSRLSGSVAVRLIRCVAGYSLPAILAGKHLAIDMMVEPPAEELLTCDLGRVLVLLVLLVLNLTSREYSAHCSSLVAVEISPSLVVLRIEDI